MMLPILGTIEASSASLHPFLSTAIQEAYASAPTDVVILNTLEIRHPSFTQPIRVVSDYTPINATLEQTAPLNAGESVEFIPFAFEMTLPEMMDRGVPELNIRLDNVSREILENIELAIPMPDKLEVTYRAFLSNDLAFGPHNDPPLHLTITSIEADAISISARASIADFVNKKFPSKEYDERQFPGLIAE